MAKNRKIAIYISVFKKIYKDPKSQNSGLKLLKNIYSLDVEVILSINDSADYKKNFAIIENADMYLAIIDEIWMSASSKLMESLYALGFKQEGYKQLRKNLPVYFYKINESIDLSIFNGAEDKGLTILPIDETRASQIIKNKISEIMNNSSDSLF